MRKLLEKFELICPKSKEELFNTLDRHKEKRVLLMAGGTDLIPQLRERQKYADYIVDLEGLGLDYIRLEQGEIRIGALTTFRAIGRNDIVLRHIPALAKAARGLGAVQTQSIATIGGNLCSAFPSADSATPLAALDAKLTIEFKNGERIIDAIDFFAGPGKSALKDGEVLTQISIKLCDSRMASFEKVGRRKGMSLAILNCTTSFCLDENGLIQNSRIALGAVAPTPVLVKEAQAFVDGKYPGEELFRQAGQIVYENICPRCSIRGSSEYRCYLAKALVTKHLDKTFEQFGVK